MEAGANSVAQNQQPINPLDSQKVSNRLNESSFVKNIVSTETAVKEENLLEEAPEVDMTLLQDVLPPKSALLILLKSFFGILVISSIASLIFFTSQLTNKLSFINSTFGVANISNELSSSNSEIIQLQTNLNFYRYLQLKAYFDEFSFYGDSYINSYEISISQTAENADIKQAAEEMTYLKDYLKESFINTKNILTGSFTAPLFNADPDKINDENELISLFGSQLTQTLTEKANSLVNSKDAQAQRDYKSYMHTTKLVNNTQLRDVIFQTDFDNLSDQELYEFIKNVNNFIVNDLSVIQRIKENRIKWSEIINEIHVRTMAVDAYYDDDFYDELGGIRYTSYDFDSGGPSISIVGETKRFDTAVFTMVVNLIDELNRSELFTNAEMKSFSKSGSAESGYTSSIKLNLGLKGMEGSSTDNAAITTGDMTMPPGGLPEGLAPPPM